MDFIRAFAKETKGRGGVRGGGKRRVPLVPGSAYQKGNVRYLWVGGGLPSISTVACIICITAHRPARRGGTAILFL